MSIANGYGDPQERIKQLEQQLAAHQRSLDYWTEQAENAECRISRQKERIEQLETALRKIKEIDENGLYREEIQLDGSGRYAVDMDAVEELSEVVSAALAQPQEKEI